MLGLHIQKVERRARLACFLMSAIPTPGDEQKHVSVKRMF
jgi:hypothetical protein